MANRREEGEGQNAGHDFLGNISFFRHGNSKMQIDWLVRRILNSLDSRSFGYVQYVQCVELHALYPCTEAGVHWYLL